MAKSYIKSNNFSDINDFLSQYDKEGEILDEFTPMVIEEWIHTGSYIQNAHISGSLLKGMPSGRVWTIAGDPKTGKSFVLFNVMRHCQELGYIPILIETEASPDKDRFIKQKLDTARIRITQPDTAKDASNFLGPMLNDLANTKKLNDTIKDPSKKKVIPKLAIFIDSINGFMASTQLKSAVSGDMKTDMGTSSTEVGDLFKLLVKKCALLNIPVIATAHTTIERTMFGSKRKPKGGNAAIFYSSIVTMLDKKFDRDEDTKERQGILVNSYLFESRYATYKDISFYIPFQRGMNPYLGLLEYTGWKECGIAKGKWVDRVDVAYEFLYKKLITQDNIVGFEFDRNALTKNLSKAKLENIDSNLEKLIKEGFIESSGNAKWKFTKKIAKNFVDGSYIKLEGKIQQLNPNSPKWVVRHLEGEILETNQLFTSRVFTDELLKELDDNVIKPRFELSGGSEEEASELDVDTETEDFFKV